MGRIGSDVVTKGGKQPGAGRPPAPKRPHPVTWRPATEEQVKKYRELGGAKWLRRMIDQTPLFPESKP
jgi:hypothetical protein